VKEKVVFGLRITTVLSLFKKVTYFAKRLKMSSHI